MQSKVLHLTVSWIINCMRKADKNEDNRMNLKELKHFLRQINVEVDDVYAEEIFKVKSKEMFLGLKWIFFTTTVVSSRPFCDRNVTRLTPGHWRALKSSTSMTC